MLKAFKEQLEPRPHLLRPERQAPRVLLVLRATPEPPVILDPQATREHLARLVQKVRPGPLGQ